MKLRALRTLKWEAKFALHFVFERGAPLHLALAGQSNCARSCRRQPVAVVCWRKQTRGLWHIPTLPPCWTGRGCRCACSRMISRISRSIRCCPKMLFCRDVNSAIVLAMATIASSASPEICRRIQSSINSTIMQWRQGRSSLFSGSAMTASPLGLIVITLGPAD